MEKTTYVVLSAVFLIVCFAAGIGMGMLFKMPQIAKLNLTVNSYSALKSGIITSIVATGKVGGISGRIVNLTLGKETMAIRIGDKAEIYSYSNAPSSEKVIKNFSDIKIGDSLTLQVRLSADNQIEARSVVILPSAEK